MGMPDADIFPHATGKAAEVVEKHKAEQDLMFYSGWFCPFVQRSWVTLEEKGIPYQYVEINPYHKSPEYLKINPKGLVPAIQHKGKAIYESTVLMEYLDEAFPETKRVFPEDPLERALIRIQVDYLSKKIIPTFFKVVQAQEKDAQQEANKELVESLKDITSRVKGPFYTGEDFGAVDIAITPFFKRFYILEKHRGFSHNDVGADFRKWYDACTQHPSIVATTSDPEHYEEIYGRYLRNEAQSEMAKSTRGEKSHV